MKLDWPRIEAGDRICFDGKWYKVNAIHVAMKDGLPRLELETRELTAEEAFRSTTE